MLPLCKKEAKNESINKLICRIAAPNVAGNINLRTFLTLGNKEKYTKEKTKLVCITPSGTFTKRSNDALIEHFDVLFLENRIVWPKYNA